MSRPRILLADDHSSILDRVVRLVADEFDVVGAVGAGPAALGAAALLAPALVLFDLPMAWMGSRTARRVRTSAAHRLSHRARRPGVHRRGTRCGRASVRDQEPHRDRSDAGDPRRARGAIAVSAARGPVLGSARPGLTLNRSRP